MGMELPQAVIEQLVRDELLGLRATKERINENAFAACPIISSLFPAHDALSMWGDIGAVLKGAAVSEHRPTKAAAISLMAPANTVLGRLEYVGEAMSVDQRHARRLSDEGMTGLARLLMDHGTLVSTPLHLINLANLKKPVLHIKTRGNLVAPIVQLDHVELKMTTVSKSDEELHQRTALRLPGDRHVMTIRWEHPQVPVLQYLQETVALDYWVTFNAFRFMALLEFYKRA